MRQTFDSVRVELVHDRRLDIGEITNPQDVGEGEVNALPWHVPPIFLISPTVPSILPAVTNMPWQARGAAF